jgi:hypothetical protein
MTAFSPKALLDLADQFDAWAVTKPAKAECLRNHGAMLREAHRRLVAREKRSSFEPPTLEQVVAYAKEKHPAWPRQDIEQWFNHFESCGWVIGKGKPMKDWQRAADNGFANWKERHPEARTVTARRNEDPEGWREFLKTLKRPYVEFRYEAEFIRSDFAKSRPHER